MMAEAGITLDPADKTSREYERILDPKYLEEIRSQQKSSQRRSLPGNQCSPSAQYEISRTGKATSGLGSES
jgi:hypothetical protein